MRRMWELFAAICLVAISSYGVAQEKRTEKPFETLQTALATINTKNVVSPIKNPFAQGEATRLAMATLNHRPLQRSLWPDGGICAHERNRAPCTPAQGKACNSTPPEALRFPKLDRRAQFRLGRVEAEI